MPLPRPTLTALIEQSRTEIEARLPGADARLRRSMLDVLARIVSGNTHGLYGAQEFILRQAFADTADEEYLRRTASIFGVQEIPAEFARGNITITGTSGLVVEQDTVLRRADLVEYITTAQVTLASGSATAPVIASAAGAAGNAAVATAVRFVSPLAGINTQAAVASGGLTGGTDVESVEALRARLLERLRHPPGGGTIYDYQSQVFLYPGVTNVFVHSQQYGAGTVGVAPLFYDRASPIPIAGDLTAIAALLNVATFKPLCATITVYALTAVAVNFTATITPNTADVQAAAAAAIRDLFRREAVPGGTLLISRIREAFSQAAGETDHVLTSPSANVNLAGDLTKLSTVGTFSW